MTQYKQFDCDVLVIGAGGAGLRAAIEAADQGGKVFVVTKSLLGKAHTVMAEGGIAASMGNLYPQDGWKVHFRDTMRGGKFLNNWQMALIHAKEVTDRVYELEAWGALFDRTDKGLISQRDFGGHRFARLAHVGDRTGLEMMRVLQNKVVSKDVEVFMEFSIISLLVENEVVCGALGYQRTSGEFIVFSARAVILATGGIGRLYEITSNSWESSGDGHALALQAGAELIDMEFIQFHPTGMVWPPSVRGLLVTEGVRGDGGALKNSLGQRFMFNYIPKMFEQETADSEEEADRWYVDKQSARRTPDLLPRDEVAKAINSEVKQGRGSPHGGVFLDIATRRDPEYIKRKLPSMYRQFLELADVDITKDPMEVGPTCHYIMGGLRVNPETTASSISGLFAVGEVAGGMHGANRLGGNSLGDLLVFGKRAGQAAFDFASNVNRQSLNQAKIEDLISESVSPLKRHSGYNPYELEKQLQSCMQSNVGIVRTDPELRTALEVLEDLSQKATQLQVSGTTKFNPGWNLSQDLPSMILVAKAITIAALERKESRGAHTRIDFPIPDEDFGKTRFVVKKDLQDLSCRSVAIQQPPPQLQELLRT